MIRIGKFPKAWNPVGSCHRRCLFRRFPYAVLYSLNGTEIIVAGVIDLRMDPQNIQQRRKET